MGNDGDIRRVLHIVSSMDRGGAETLIMNIYRNIDRSKIQFDFITHTKGNFDDEIISLGGKIHQISSLGKLGPINYIKELKRIMTLENYEAIHSHTDYQSGFPAIAARLSGIKKRLCHSHSNNWPKNKGVKEKLFLEALKALIKFSATNYCSCSIEAAEFLFGKRLLKKGKVEILNNGINIDEFLKENNCRESVLDELAIPRDAKIIGHVGKFSESKNHLFILKVLKKILVTNQNYVAVLVGDGPLKKGVESEAEKIGLIKNVRFLGVRSDIPRLMKTFDVFLFPSFFEGFGIATIEAQCSGTPCVVSDVVPRTTDMKLGLMSYINLKKDIEEWSNTVMCAAMLKRPSNEAIRQNFINSGYSIQENVPKWLSLYLKDDQLSVFDKLISEQGVN
jgi:glycosyltransferase EpsF